MPELACYSFKEYHDKALQMATDKAIRVHYKGLLAMRMEGKVWPSTPKQQAVEMEILLLGI
jgi:predicted O-linked N-acetylglucosamine transferase (SPINDLY family)